MLIGQQANLELRTDRTDHGIARVHQERPRAIVSDLEMSLALAQIDLAEPAAQVGLDDGVGIEAHDRAVRERHVALLTDGGGEGLDVAALAHPENPGQCPDENGRGGTEPPAPRHMHRRMPRRPGEARRFLIARGLPQAVERPPDPGEFVESPPVPRVLPEPGIECFVIRRADLVAVQAPGPFRRLFVDFGPRAQFDDVTHEPSPRSRARRRVSPAVEGSEGSSMPCSRR